MMGERVACAAVSTHLHVQSYTLVRRYQPRRQLHSDFGDFSNGVCYVMKIAKTESNPDMELLTQ